MEGMELHQPLFTDGIQNHLAVKSGWKPAAILQFLLSHQTQLKLKAAASFDALTASPQPGVCGGQSAPQTPNLRDSACMGHFPQKQYPTSQPDDFCSLKE